MRWFITKVSGLWGWSRRFPKKVTIQVAAIFLLLFFFAASKGADAYNYMQENPNFCRACHTMQTAWDRWYTSEHRNVTCHSCHEVNPLEGAQLLITFALKMPENVSKHATVQDGVCKSCHESNNPRWLQIADTAGHKVHAEEQNIACTKCHALTLHRFSPPGPLCRACHQEQAIKASQMAELHCSTCHDFLGKNEALLPDRLDCLRCHLALANQKVTWPADAPMQFTCQTCHKPHEQAAPVVDCLSCHRNLGSLHLDSAAQRVQCQTCHTPHEWRISGVARKGPPATPSPAATTPSAATPSAATPTAAAAATPAAPTAVAPTAAAPTAVAPTAAAPKSPPAIPHSLEGRSDCLVCHSATGIKPFPANHAGRTKETCTACHTTKQ